MIRYLRIPSVHSELCGDWSEDSVVIRAGNAAIVDCNVFTESKLACSVLKKSENQFIENMRLIQLYYIIVNYKYLVI